MPGLRWPMGPDQSLARHLVMAASIPPKASAKPEGGVVVFPNAGQDSLWIWRAVLTAPATGDYRFFIAADDAGTLWVSEDATRARRQVAAFTEQWTDPTQWNRYPTQKSRPIRLEQGKKYALEMAWTNRSGLGHAAVGWQPPGAAAPAPLPLANKDGSQLLELFNPPPDDTDIDALPDDWERDHGLKVAKGDGEQGGFGDPDGDGATNQEEYRLGTDPNKKEGMPGHLTCDLWSNVPAVNIAYGYPEDLPWNMPGKPAFSVQPLDRLPAPGGYAAVRLRCLLKVPRDGYYQLAAEAPGFQQVLLSDDATPDRLRPLWRDGALWEDHGPGFKDHRLRLDSPWVFFKRDEPRYLEIRHLHTPGLGFIHLAWTAGDGIRRDIPPECVTSYLPPEAEPPPPTDGGYHRLLPDTADDEVRLDLRAARALTTGWAEFGPGSSGWEEGLTNNKRKLPDFGLCTTFGGSIEIPFATATAGYHALVIDAQLSGGGKVFAHFEICREIDGIRFGREVLSGMANDGTTFRTLTPWLAKGDHTLRLHLAPDRYMESFRLLAVALRPLAGDTAQQSAKAQLARENTFLPGRADGDWLISPACVEMTTRVSAAPQFKADGRNIAVREGSPGGWWADVPLPESGAPVALTCAFAADQTTCKATARWAETRVHEHPEIYLRTGDALRLTAWQDGGDGSTATLTIGGRETATPAGKPLVRRFEQPGDETITAVFTPQAGEPVRSKLIVHVLPRLTTAVETTWTCTDRVSPLPPLPAGARPDGGTGAAFRTVPDGGWVVAPRAAGEWPAAVRAGPTGPVLGAIMVRGMELTYQLRLHETDAEHLSRGFRDRATYYVIVRGLPPEWKISFDQYNLVNRPWAFLRPDQAKPLRQEVHPWRYGVCAVGEFWFKRTGQPEAWLPGDFGVVPPAK